MKVSKHCFLKVFSDLAACQGGLPLSMGCRPVAGNDEILVTAIAPCDWASALTAGEVAFSTELATAPERKRVAIATPVSGLHKVMNELKKGGVAIQHVYDY